jgi:hypothetical protein
MQSSSTEVSKHGSPGLQHRLSCLGFVIGQPASLSEGECETNLMGQ